MKTKIGILLIASFIASGCVANQKPNNLIDYSPQILSSLNKEKDNFEGKIIITEEIKYTINETLANDKKLCRVVTLDYKVEDKLKRKLKTYCKTKGGEWK